MATKRDTAARASAGDLDFLRQQLAVKLDSGDVRIPMLPEVAVRVIQAAGDPDVSARDMAQIIYADPALAAHVMRLVTSTAYRPAQPIQSLHHAISWLGMGEVCELAFTAAVKSRLLNIPRQRARTARLWATAVGSAAWARVVADVCGRGGEVAYLAGLMHELGVPVCLQACVDIGAELNTVVSDEAIDALVAEFKGPVGTRVATAWELPPTVAGAIAGWATWEIAVDHRDQCAVTYLAHQLAEHTLAGSEPLALALNDDPVVAHLKLAGVALGAVLGQAPLVEAMIDGFRL